MNKRTLAYLLFFLITLQFACADSTKNTTNQPREINFDDRLKIVKNLETGEYKTASFEIKELKDSIKTLADNSTLNTMFDGAGNKTETRFFDNHPLIKNIILRTSARGEKQSFVYAQNGAIEILPEYIIAKALTASANELSKAAGIFHPRKMEDFKVKDENPASEIGILQTLPKLDLLPETLKTENEKSETVKAETSKEKVKETTTESESLAPWIEHNEKDLK
jgi:hypothetical protein